MSCSNRRASRCSWLDPSYTRSACGHPKTDRRDGQWIYRLHSVGLLAPAFRPDEKTCQLRAYLRQRATLIRSPASTCSTCRKPGADERTDGDPQRHHQATGRAILRAILRDAGAGEAGQYRDKGCKAKRDGDRSGSDRDAKEEHLFELKLAYETWQFTLKQVEKVDTQIALQLGRMKW